MNSKFENIVVVNNPFNSSEKIYIVIGLDDCSFFNSLSDYVSKHFSAVLVNNDEGLITKEATFKILNEFITLKYHEDIGNYFCNSNGKALTTLLKDLDNRLSALDD